MTDIREIKTSSLIIVILASVFIAVTISVGIIISSSGIEKIPQQFVIVNKEYHPPEMWYMLPWKSEEFRIYFSGEGYILTDKESYNKFKVGDWFNGTILIYL